MLIKCLTQVDHCELDIEKAYLINGIKLYYLGLVAINRLPNPIYRNNHSIL